MRNSIRLLSMLLAVIMVFSLAACGNEGSGDNNSSIESVVSTETSTEETVSDETESEAVESEEDATESEVESEKTSSKTQSANKTSSKKASSKKNSSKKTSSKTQSKVNTSSKVQSVANTSSKVQSTANTSSKVQSVANASSKVENTASKTQSKAPGTQTSSKVEDTSVTTSKTWKEVLSKMPKKLSGTTLKIASWNEVEQVKGAPEVIAKFKKMTGVDVKWQVINYGEYTTQIAAMIAAKKSPDIVRLHTLDVGDVSVLQPITASNFNFNDTAWHKETSDLYTLNGKTYAVALKDSLFHQPTAVFYNKDLIAQYDLEDPYELWKTNKWTFDKFVEICRDFRDEAGEGFTPWSTQGLFDYANFLGTGFTAYDGTKFVNNLSDKKLLTAWQQTLKWIEEGVTSQGFWDHDGFNSGKVLFHTTGMIAARTTQAYFTKHKANGTLGIVPVPQIAGEKYNVVAYEMEAYGIAKGSKNPETVPYFLRYYLDASNYDKNNFFCDKRAMEVYDWYVEQGNFIDNFDTVVITKDAGYDKDLVSALKVAKPEQVATILESYNAVVNRACQQTNDKLKTFK